MNAQPTINTNAKSQLAKLLATENISIQYNPNASTASFDVKSRVLYLPVWQNISEDLHDMLSVHETGHAIDTPADGWESALKTIAKKYYDNDDLRYMMAIKSFLNVVEDARIDKRQKRRYPGSKRNYLAGYKELLERDFFGIKDREVASLTFIDRANIYFKGGNLLLDIPFSAQERQYLSKMENTETWEQVVELTDMLFGLAKSKQEEQNNISQSDLEASADEDGDMEGYSDDSDNGEGDESSDAMSYSYDDADDADDDGDFDEESDDTSTGDLGGYSSSDAVPEAQTDRTYEERKQQIVSNSGYTFNYFKIPTFDYTEIVDDYPKFLADCDLNVKNSIGYYSKDWMDTNIAELNKFKAEENATISYMVKEFEMRKAADLYSRISVSKTGVIDTNKLHSYKYNDDIFRRLATVPQGKNHGFIMFLDWSGSMHGNLKYTMKQLFGLTMFCKRVQIPFEVYLFRDHGRYDTEPKNKTYSVANQNSVFFAGYFKLRNVLSSRMKSQELIAAYNHLWALCKIHSPYDTMNGTPLDPCIAAASKLVNDFRTRNKLQVVNTIFLTDGESAPTNFGVAGVSNNNKAINIIQDDVTKKEYRVDRSRYYWTRTTPTWLKILKERTGCNLIGFYLYETTKFSRLADRFELDANPEYRNKMQDMWKNDKFISVTSEGYDEYYIINTPSSKNDTDTQLKIDSSMSKNKMAKAFAKFSQKKTVNRILLNRFMEKVSKNG